MLRIPGMTSNKTYLTVAVDVLTSSWFDLLLPRTSHTHIDLDYWRPIQCMLTRDERDEDLHDKDEGSINCRAEGQNDLLGDLVSESPLRREI